MQTSLVLLSGLLPATWGQNYTIQTIAGGGQQNNVLGTSPHVSMRRFNYLALDRAGNLYFPSGNRILRWNAATQVVTVFAGVGIAGFSGDSGPATLAQLNNPQGITLDASGNVHFVDAGNLRIRRIAGGVITTIAGNGVKGSNGDNGPAANAQFHSPQAIAIDAEGSIYVAEVSGYRVRKISNGVITAFAGTGTEGYSGDLGPAVNATLSQPTSLAVGPDGTVYIATSVGVVRAVSRGVITSVAGVTAKGPTGDGGPATSAYIEYPAGVIVDPAGNLYIADTQNNRVRVATK